MALAPYAAERNADSWLLVSAFAPFLKGCRAHALQLRMHTPTPQQALHYGDSLLHCEEMGDNPCVFAETCLRAPAVPMQDAQQA